jgi:hypothetical protein
MKALPAGKARRVSRTSKARTRDRVLGFGNAKANSESRDRRRIRSAEAEAAVNNRPHVSNWAQATRIALDLERPTPTS